MFAARCRDGIKEIIFVFYFLTDIFLRNVSGDTYRFFGILHGVCNRPVPSPATNQAVMVGMREGFVSHNVLYPGAENFVSQRLVEKCFYQQVTVPGIENVAIGHIQFLALIFPPFDLYLCDGTYGAVGKDTFGTEGHRLYVSGFGAIPAFQCTDAAAVAHHQHIVAEAAFQLRFGGIELAFFNFQPFVEFAVWVNGLFLVEIDAVAH